VASREQKGYSSFRKDRYPILYCFFLEQEQKSLATIDKKMGVIRTLAKFLEKPELTFGIELKPVEKNNDIETLSTIEYTRLLKEVKKEGNLRNITIVYVLLHTGIRVSELCRLNRSNIDLIKNILIVQKDGEERVITLSQELREHLQYYLDSHSFEEAIFMSPSGVRLTERAVNIYSKSLM
jgi:integrase/recombinase XerD